jgi:hypothetical protein
MTHGFDAKLTRRSTLIGAGATALTAALGGPALAKPKPISVALVASVPIEQQWVSRIHIA